MSNPTPTPESLLNDASFVQYCLYPDSPEAVVWRQRRLEDPSLDAAAGNALLIFAAIRDETSGATAENTAADFRRLFEARFDPTALRPGVVRRPWIPAAVAAVGLLLLAAWWFMQPTPNPSAQVSLEKPATTLENQTQTAWHAGFDRRRTIQLPDGTTVTLNYNSTLTKGPAYNADRRDVKLEGEAFFEVAHDPARPFVVQAGNTATLALGTAFLVRAYAVEKTVNVLLHNGKVKVTEMSGGMETILLPGEQFTGQTAEKSTKQAFEPARLERWAAETLTFDNAAPEQIARQLEAFYGIGVRLENLPRNAKHFSGVFKNEPLENTLNVIGMVQGFEYTLQQNTLLLRFKK